MSLVALNGSHSASSSTHAVAALAAEIYASGEAGAAGDAQVIDLVTLDPAALVGVGKSGDVTAALDAIAAADVVVIVTPTYRATYSGLLKVLLDQLPQAAFAGKAVVLAATAGRPDHFLALDTGGRALVASLDGWTVPTVTYATPDDFDDAKNPSEAIRTSLSKALREAARLTG